MALTITKLKMWKDPGYTRGCIEVPPAGSKKLPAPDYTSAADETLRPHKGSTLTELHLPLSFTECFDMSYLYIEASDGKGSVSLFGWIDSVSQRSTAAEGVTITWSVDWWRSYSGSAVFGRGCITRCSDPAYKRPYDVTPRYRYVNTVQNIESDLTDNNTAWCILKVANRSYDPNTQSWKSSGLRTLFFPFRITGGYWQIHQANIAGGTDMDSCTAPSGKDVFNGTVASVLGIDSEAIVGAWYSPIAPLRKNMDYIYQNGEIYATYLAVKLFKNGTYGAFEYDDSQQGIMFLTNTTYIFNIDASGKQTDDDVVYAVTNCDNTVIGSSPYGMKFKNMIVIFNIGATSANLRVILTPQASFDWGDVAEGKVFEIPLPPLAITSNSWSDYVYSGQRNYEIESRIEQNNQQNIQGVTSVAGGAVSGAVVGSVVPGIGTAAGALVGGAMGLIGTGVTAYINEMNRQKIQDLEDKKYADQFGKLMIPGDGLAYIYSKGIPKLITMTADSVSKSEYDADIAANGYRTQLMTSSAASFITAGGPLRISELTITGSIPPQAKNTMMNMLGDGVFIIEKNPSGVVP